MSSDAAERPEELTAARLANRVLMTHYARPSPENRVHRALGRRTPAQAFAARTTATTRLVPIGRGPPPVRRTASTAPAL